MVDLIMAVLELIRLTSTDLPTEVESQLEKALTFENVGSPPYIALESILENVKIARNRSIPICQDTGTLNFSIAHPIDLPVGLIKNQIMEAVKTAQELNYLRPLVADPWSNESTPNENSLQQVVTFHFEESAEKLLTIHLLLKGGGCENVSAQFSLPDETIHAGRDLDGVRKCALQTVFQAQGRGCSPGILGIAIGGDRAMGFDQAKTSLLRRLDDSNPQLDLAALEQQITDEANELGIGPMGFGGKSTILGTKIESLPRLPASFFVTVSYNCWAYRHRQLIIDGNVVSFI